MSLQRIITRPNGLDLDSPGRRDYLVALDHDSVWGDHLIPLTVLVGPEAATGRGLVAFGANHGNEYEGPLAIKHWMHEIRLDEVRGRIILVPVLNPSAFFAGIRESADDGVNLNRAFVDGAGSTPSLSGITHRIAKFVREQIWPRVHVVIDLHAGGDVARFALNTSFYPHEDPARSKQLEETARWFGAPLVIAFQAQTVGLLPWEAASLGKISIGAELGWGRSAQSPGVRFARHGLRAAAIHHDQMRGEVRPIAHHADGTQRLLTLADRACYTPAPFSGHYEPLLDCGAEVRAGDIVGLLHDFNHIDQSPWPARAGVDGIVVAQAWLAPVPRGQHIVVVGQVKGR